MVYVCMVYGPIAAFLVELFPTKIRYTSMSLPYHLGNGWFGGFLPLIATAVTASAWAKDLLGPNAMFAGLIYPIADLPDHHRRLRPLHPRDQGPQDRRRGRRQLTRGDSLGRLLAALHLLPIRTSTSPSASGVRGHLSPTGADSVRGAGSRPETHFTNSGGGRRAPGHLDAADGQQHERCPT